MSNVLASFHDSIQQRLYIIEGGVLSAVDAIDEITGFLESCLDPMIHLLIMRKHLETRHSSVSVWLIISNFIVEVNCSCLPQILIFYNPKMFLYVYVFLRIALCFHVSHYRTLWYSYKTKIYEPLVPFHIILLF